MTLVLGSIIDATKAPVAHSLGDRWEIVGQLTISSTYAAGGDALDPTTILGAVGVGVVDKVNIDPVNGYILTYDYANKKIKVWDTTTNAEFATGAYSAALLAATPHILVLGR